MKTTLTVILLLFSGVLSAHHTLDPYDDENFLTRFFDKGDTSTQQYEVIEGLLMEVTRRRMSIQAAEEFNALSAGEQIQTLHNKYFKYFQDDPDNPKDIYFRINTDRRMTSMSNAIINVNALANDCLALWHYTNDVHEENSKKNEELTDIDTLIGYATEVCGMYYAAEADCSKEILNEYPDLWSRLVDRENKKRAEYGNNYEENEAEFYLRYPRKYQVGKSWYLLRVSWFGYPSDWKVYGDTQKMRMGSSRYNIDDDLNKIPEEQISWTLCMNKRLAENKNQGYKAWRDDRLAREEESDKASSTAWSFRWKLEAHENRLYRGKGYSFFNNTALNDLNKVRRNKALVEKLRARVKQQNDD